MKKHKYTWQEINDLLKLVRSLGSDDTEQLNIVVEALSTYVLDCNRVEPLDKEYLIEAHQTIAAYAHQLECEAKSLRAIVRAFHKPVKEIPKDLNDSNKIISKIASWRLKLGR